MQEYGRIYRNGKFEHRMPYMSIMHNEKFYHDSGLSHGRWIDCQSGIYAYAILDFRFHGRVYGQRISYGFGNSEQIE